MTREEARKKASAFFREGYNCAQSVVKALAEELGADEEECVRAAQAFGAGMARMREVCGTVSGMFMALGLAIGSGDPKDKARKDALYAAAQSLAAEFKRRNGSIICAELLGLPGSGGASPPESEERTAEYYKKRPCAELCGEAAEIFQKWLTENAL